MDRAADAAACGADAIWAGDPHVAAVRIPPCRETAPPALIVSPAQTAASRTAGRRRPGTRMTSGRGSGPSTGPADSSSSVVSVGSSTGSSSIGRAFARRPPRVRVRPPLGRYTRTVTEGHSPIQNVTTCEVVGTGAFVRIRSVFSRSRRDLSGAFPVPARPGHSATATVFSSGSPAAQRLSWPRNSRLARGRKAEVGPPTCGVISTPGACQSGWPAGSGSGSVTSSAARSRPDSSSASRDFGVHHPPARDVDEQCSVLHPGEETRAHQAPGLLGERGAKDHHVGARQQFGRAARAACTGPRGTVRSLRATRSTSSTSKGSSRSSTAAPIAP